MFLLDAGVGAEPMPGFTQLMTAFIDDEKNNDLMEVGSRIFPFLNFVEFIPVH